MADWKIIQTMKIYFSCSSSGLPKFLREYNFIRKTIKGLNNEIIFDWIDRSFNEVNKNQLTKDDEINIHEEGINAIGSADALVADVSFPSASVGFQVGLALSRKIPVLCIYSEELGDKEAPRVTQAIKSPLLLIRSYTEKSLKKVIYDFFGNLPESKLIKFNFIITTKISEYLNWGSEKNNISKSDFLREIVEKIIDSDPEFKKKH